MLFCKRRINVILYAKLGTAPNFTVRVGSIEFNKGRTGPKSVAEFQSSRWIIN